MTAENNKIIAEFMGFIKEDSNTNWFYSIDKGRYFRENELLYNLDWNWLMEVVEKIESLGFNFNITSKDATVLQYHRAIYQTLIYKIDGTNKIQAVYNTCLAFIEWYNKNK